MKDNFHLERSMFLYKVLNFVFRKSDRTKYSLTYFSYFCSLKILLESSVPGGSVTTSVVDGLVHTTLDCASSLWNLIKTHSVNVA